MRRRLAGILGAAVALGTTELMAGIFEPVPSLVGTVGEAVIDLSPSRLVKFGIRTFGTNDKLALGVGIVIISVLAGGALGRAAARRWWVAPLGFAAFGAVGLAAAARDPLASTGWALLTIAVASAVGLFTLYRMLAVADSVPETVGTIDIARSAAADAGRRRFVLTATAASAAAIIAPALGRRLRQRFNVEAARSDVVLATPTQGSAATATPVAATTGLEVEGLSPLVTPNSDFYRIDTAFLTPQVDPSGWTLKIRGEVDNPFELTFDELLEMATHEAPVTLTCVSNEVGGDLIGNAVWTGVPLVDLLDRAGVRPTGTQVVGRSVDGFTAGFPTDLAYDGREAMVAVGMNGEPLPIPHGFPARLVVAGVYGYVSATKWLDAIELTDFDSVDGYWIPRGWSKLGPIKTQSRVDVPRDRTTITAGMVPVAGVAWAQSRGIERVEVQIDDGPWVDADLGDELSINTWRQWLLPWNATPGRHEIRVRATDSTGMVQPMEHQPPRPDGATGYHQVTVQVEEA
ncbi:MAG TPA: hypothetical protein ENI86_09010 [Acidimicrobiales bacterium]|nr:hypothetical protein [Acidimicrobiales bacterium]